MDVPLLLLQPESPRCVGLDRSTWACVLRSRHGPGSSAELPRKGFRVALFDSMELLRPPAAALLLAVLADGLPTGGQTQRRQGGGS
jgi:hypothetical protein